MPSALASGDRGVGLLVRDRRERDAVGLEMLGYLSDRLTPSSRQGNRASRGYAPAAHWQYRPTDGAGGRIIACTLQPVARASHHARRRGRRDGQRHLQAAATRIALPRAGFHSPCADLAAGQARQVRVAAPGLRG